MSQNVYALRFLKYLRWFMALETNFLNAAQCGKRLHKCDVATHLNNVIVFNKQTRR
jgi:hypothetical protein